MDPELLTNITANDITAIFICMRKHEFFFCAVVNNTRDTSGSILAANNQIKCICLLVLFLAI
jgi:hypothetical protein